MINDRKIGKRFRTTLYLILPMFNNNDDDSN